MEKEKALEKYGDDVAAGHTAAVLQDCKDNVDLHQLDIGNILPGQTATIQVELMQPLLVTGGSFEFNLPMTYFPKYYDPAQPSQQVEPTIISKTKKDDTITFNFECQILSADPISAVSHPQHLTVLEQSPNRVFLQKIGADFLNQKKDIQIRYKTKDMETPKLVYQVSSKYPEEVAVMAQFLPKFGAGVQPQDKIEFTTDQEGIEEDDVDPVLEDKCCFLFVVDRSGSMGGQRMDITREALKLFMMSLPSGSYFEIISFGSNYSFMKG